MYVCMYVSNIYTYIHADIQAQTTYFFCSAPGKYVCTSEDPQEAMVMDGLRYVGRAKRTTKHEVLRDTYMLKA